MRSKTLLIAATVVLGLVWPQVARADNTTCANANPMMIGETASDSLAASPASRFYKIRVKAGRSYAAILWQPFNDAGEGGSNTDLSVYSDATCTTATSSTIDTDPDTDWPDADGDAVSFTPTADGDWRLEAKNQNNNAATIRLLVVETTLTSPWWYVGATYLAYVEIRNNSNISRSYTLRVYTGAGVECGTTTGSLAANGATFININAYPACVADPFYGSARLTYVGAPGGFSANATTLSATTGISFDAPFSPMMGWSAGFSAR